MVSRDYGQQIQTVSQEILTINHGRRAEEALKAVPGVYATTQVRRASDRITAPNVFTCARSGRPAEIMRSR